MYNRFWREVSNRTDRPLNKILFPAMVRSISLFFTTNKQQATFRTKTKIKEANDQRYDEMMMGRCQLLEEV